MAATMDRTYSVSVKGMLGEKSGSKVLYDKLLKVNAHEQFVDIADRAGSDVFKPEHVLCTVKASKDEVTFKTVDKHETASILLAGHSKWQIKDMLQKKWRCAFVPFVFVCMSYILCSGMWNIDLKKKFRPTYPIFFSMLRQSNNFFFRP